MLSTESSLVESIEKIAVNTKVFNACEIQILREVASDFLKSPDKDYSLVSTKNRQELTGFIIYGRTPLTQNTWDLYWLAVDPMFYGKGLGRKLMSGLFQNIKSKDHKMGVIRVETSSRPDYEPARNLYLKTGFNQVGQIDHFYRKNDHLLIYSKQL